MLDTSTNEADVRALLTDALRLGDRGKKLTRESALLGSLPELDSMAVVTIVTVLEEHFDIEFDDEDITAEAFETLGALCRLVETRLSQE